MNDQIKVPAGMPVLSKGGHSSPEQGACVMEYVSMIMGLGFTDTPSCTHPAIATIAMTANDNMPDEARHQLVPLIPRLAHAGSFEDHTIQSVSRRALTWYADNRRPELGASGALWVMFVRDALNLYDAMAVEAGQSSHQGFDNYATKLAEAVQKVGVRA